MHTILITFFILPAHSLHRLLPLLISYLLATLLAHRTPYRHSHRHHLPILLPTSSPARTTVLLPTHLNFVALDQSFLRGLCLSGRALFLRLEVPVCDQG